MDVQFASKPSFRIAGLLHRTSDPGTISALWQRFDPSALPATGCVSYGACDHFDPATGAFDYLAAMEVAADAAIPEGFTAWEIPANEYAVFPVHMDSIQADFNTFHGEWLPTSEYEMGAGPSFELYDEQFDPADPHALFYTYMPVVRKAVAVKA